MTHATLDESAVAAAWDDNAESWTRQVRAGSDAYRDLYTWPAFRSFMPGIRGLDVIDLGCGEGENTRRMARLGGRMYGIDISAKLIAKARVAEKDAPLGIQYRVASFADLGEVADASFDCALSTMALMDGPHLDRAMAEAYRVLKPGGALCFSVLHPCFVTPQLEWLRDDSGAIRSLRVGNYFDSAPSVERWEFSKRADPTPVDPFTTLRFPFTLSDYLNALCDAGFRIKRVEEPRPDEELVRAHSWLMRWRVHAPLVLLVHAQKEG